MEQLITQLIWVPAIAGLLCLILPRIKVIKELISGVAAAWVLYISARLWATGGFALTLANYDIAGIPFSVHLIGKPLNLMAVLFVGLFGVLGVLYSWRYRAGEKGNHLYYAYMLWTLVFSNLALLSDNMLVFLVAWELSTLFLYALVNSGHIDKAKSATAGFRTFAVLGFSEAALLLGIIIIWVTQGRIHFSQLNITTTGTLNVILYLMFFSAAAAKAGAMPLHAWIPAAADGAPTSVMAFLPAAIDKLLGIYLLALITINVFSVTSAIRLVIMAVGAVTILVAVMMALVQHDLKKLLAYHAVSQVGYMLLGIGTGTIVGIMGGLFHMMNNAVYKSALFFGAGNVEKATGTTDLEKLGGLGKLMPLTFFAMLVSALAISGIPPMNGFASKWMIYQSCLEAGRPVMLIVAMVGSALTLASFIKVIYSVFLGKKAAGLPDKIKEAPISMWIPPVVLAVLCILVGVFAVWPVNTFFAPVVGLDSVGSTLGAMGLSSGTFWSPTFTTLMLLVGIVLGALVYVFGNGFKPRVVKSFYGGEQLSDEDIRQPGTGFYESIEKLPVLRSIYEDAKKGVWAPDYFFAAIIDSIIVRGLKFMHSGILSTYLSWSIIGLVVIIFVLII
jgi:formate hydrogenlyase subunit 3/multisubunit Na+/H+ antiporter MnhD subunit